MTYGKRRAATGVAVQLGEDDAGEIQQIVEAFRHVYRVLTGHGVHHQKDLGGVHRIANLLQLCHQLLVHVETARRIHEDHIVAVLHGVLDRFLCGFRRLLGAPLKHGNANLLCHHLQLLDGGGTVDIAGHQQGVLALLLIHLGQLCGVGGLTRALQAAHQYHRGGLGRNIQLGITAAHECGQLLVDDLNDLLPGKKAFQHLCANGALGHLVHEGLDDLEVDVRLQKSQLDLPHARLHVGLGEFSLVAELLKSFGKLVGKIGEHSSSFLSYQSLSLIMAVSSAP